MKLEKKNIKILTNILKGIPYDPIDPEKCSHIVFPIDMSVAPVEDENSMILPGSHCIGTGSKKDPDVFIEISPEYEDTISLAYGDLQYSRKFNILDYCDLIDYKKLSKKDKDFLSNLECYLLNSDYILCSFAIN